MAWDGSGNVVRNTGVFQGPTAWQQTRDAARRVRADDHDTHDEDLATAIENTVTRDGQNQPTANLPMGGNRHINCGEGQALSDYPTLGQNQKSTTHICTVGGTGDAILLTADIAPASYQVGQKFVFYSGANNTGPVTVNVNGLGAITVKKRGGNDLEPGDIVTSEIVIIYYDGGSFLLSTLNSGLSPNGSQTITGKTMRVQWSSGTNDDGPLLQLMRTDGGTARLGSVEFRGNDDAAAEKLLLNIRGNYLTKTAGAETAEFIFGTRSGGTFEGVMRIGKGIYTQNATGGDPGADRINASQFQENGVPIYSLGGGLETEKTAAGASVEFTGIRNDARRITIMFDGVSLTGSDRFEVQLGTATAYETTGYNSLSNSYDQASNTGGSSSTSGFVVDTNTAADIVRGHMVLTYMAANKWISSHTVERGSGRMATGAGRKELGAVLTRLRIVPIGANTFDAGLINILVE